MECGGRGELDELAPRTSGQCHLVKGFQLPCPLGRGLNCKLKIGLQPKMQFG
jgi:hypothetical protein